VHVHDADVTSWDYGNDYYGNYVDQGRVDMMVEQGVMALTGTGSSAEAWQMLLPGYTPGKGIAIKVNFNNCWWCTSQSLAIDPLIHPINAIARGLLNAFPNFLLSDLWVYDATTAVQPRQIPTRFKSGCLYDGVRFFDQGCSEVAGYSSNAPDSVVVWHNPPDVLTPPATKVTDVLVNATYLINMPILKKHVGGVTLSFKNHFGSIDDCEPLHDWIFPDRSHYGGTNYSPLVDIYLNPHILGKTVLTIGDALFGNWENNLSKPQPWSTFGNRAPNSLIFAVDPVAIDCVMCDLLNSETWMFPKHDDYLVSAEAHNCGVYERGDPWASGYAMIDYRKVTLSE